MHCLFFYISITDKKGEKYTITGFKNLLWVFFFFFFFFYHQKHRYRWKWEKCLWWQQLKCFIIYQ